MFEYQPHYLSEEAASSKQILMMGVFLKNAIGYGKGPELRYANLDQLRSVKLSHPEMACHLKALQEEPGVVESWIWNTCNRFCVYAIHTGDAEAVRARLFTRFFESLRETPQVINVLENEDAIHHLLRTAAGLNSGLPGETDVIGQFESAVHLSECIGSVGACALPLVENVLSKAGRARAETSWGNYSSSYCLAALDGALSKAGRETALSGPIVIIGSSNTSRSCVEHLERDFQVPPTQITFFHRCHKSNGQVKSIRRASLGCNRRRVENYAGPEVREAIQTASLVIFGIDKDEPVLTGEELHNLREGNPAPVVILDFNTMGSTKDVESTSSVLFYGAQQLENEVHNYAENMQRDPGFWAAAEEVDALIARWIEEQREFEGSESAPFLYDLAGPEAAFVSVGALK
jgi:glutamyl-tRNA reductase